MDLGIEGLGPGVRIGLGGSAVVYRARQERLGREVAVKLLTERDPSFVRRFEREALTLGQLSRLPGIVTIHDSGVTSLGEPYLVLAYCPSSLLDRLYRDGPFAAADAAGLMARVAATVARAHEAGVLHRDLKPANILLSHEGEPLVADLGMASMLDGSGLTHSIGFTPGYAAPETLRGEPGGPDVDVYALGATLFHLVTGRVPFADGARANNLVALASAIEHQPVEDLRPDGVQGELCAIIEAAMAKDPANRPTAWRLAEWLGEVAVERDQDGAAGAERGRPLRVSPPTADPPPSTMDSRVQAVLPPPVPPVPVAPAPAGAVYRHDGLERGPADDLVPGASPRPSGARPPSPPGARPPIVTPEPPMGRRRTGTGPTPRQVVVAGTGLLATIGVAAALFNSPEDNASFVDTAFATTTSAWSEDFIETTWGPSLDEQLPSMDLYELVWERQRAEVVAALSAAPAPTGPTAEACPDGWSDTAGIDGTTIAIDLVLPANAGAEQTQIARGLQTYLEWVNGNGGIGSAGLQVQTRVATTGDTGPEPFAVAPLDAEAQTSPADDGDTRCLPAPLWLVPPGGLRNATQYSYSGDAFQNLIDNQLRAAGLNPGDMAARTGFGLYGWMWQQSLEIAAALPGGVTRSNLVAAQSGLTDMTHPMLLTGVQLATSSGDP